MSQGEVRLWVCSRSFLRVLTLKNGMSRIWQISLVLAVLLL